MFCPCSSHPFNKYMMSWKKLSFRHSICFAIDSASARKQRFVWYQVSGESCLSNGSMDLITRPMPNSKLPCRAMKKEMEGGKAKVKKKKNEMEGERR